MIQIEKGKDRTHIRLIAEDTGNGIAILLTGGERPHVGGVVLAIPRQSLTGKGTSADVFVTPVPGHKDTEVAILIAKRLCISTAGPVSVTAGIHIDDAAPQEIAQILEHCNAAVIELEERLRKE